jgi:hypothetical protein
MLISQGKTAVYALCPNGCRVFGVRGQTLAELVESMPHQRVKVRDSELVILRNPKEAEQTAAHAQESKHWR